jgi:O-antigen ligase
MRNPFLLLGLGCLFLGWNAPNHSPPWPTLHLELFAGAGLCFICLAVLTLPSGGHARDDGDTKSPCPNPGRLPLPAIAWFWLAGSLLPVLQYLVGGLAFRGDAVVGLLYGLGVVLSLYVGALWAAQQGRARVLGALCLTIVIGGLAANGLALAQWLRLEAPGWWAMELIDERPFASLGQPNHFGLLMVMAVVAVTALFEAGLIQRRWVHALAVAFFGWGVWISQSRASALALLAVVGCWLLTRRRVRTRLRLCDVLVPTALWVLLSLAIAPIQELLLLETSGLRAPAEVGARQLIWAHYWAAITERPWLGYGFNQGVLALAEVAEQVQPSRNATFAHNVVLDLMTWFGIPLAVAVVVALAYWLLSWLRRHPDGDLMAQRHLVLAMWMALAIQSMLEFPFAHAYFLLPAALLAGSVTGVTMPVRAAASIRASRTAVVLAGGSWVLLAIFTWEYFQVESDFRANRFERANFANGARHGSATRPWILDQLGALNASAHFEIGPGMPVERIETLRVLARRFHILSTRLDYARALALNGRLVEAEAELVIIRSVYDAARYERIRQEWDTWLRAKQLIAERDSARRAKDEPELAG